MNITVQIKELPHGGLQFDVLVPSQQISPKIAACGLFLIERIKIAMDDYAKAKNKNSEVTKEQLAMFPVNKNPGRN